MFKKFRVGIIFLFISVLAVCLTGCGKSKEEKDDEVYGTLKTETNVKMYAVAGNDWKEVMEIPAFQKVEILNKEINSGNHVCEHLFPGAKNTDDDIRVVEVKYQDEKGYIALSSLELEEQMVKIFGSDFLHYDSVRDIYILDEKRDLLKYSKIICDCANKFKSEDQNYDSKVLYSLESVVEEYAKRNLPFEPLITFITENYFSNSNIGLDVFKEDMNSYYGKDEDSVYIMALKNRNKYLFRYLVEEFLIYKDENDDYLLVTNLLYKNKSSKSILDYLYEINDPDLNEFIDSLYGCYRYRSIDENGQNPFSSVIEKITMDNRFEGELNEVNYKDIYGPYIYDDCTMTTVFGNQVKIEKGSLISVYGNINEAAVKGDDGRMYGIYEVKTENNISGYMSSEKFAHEKIDIEGYDSFYIQKFRKKSESGVTCNFYNKDGKKIEFKRYDKPGVLSEPIDINISKLSLANGCSSSYDVLTITNCGEHKLKGKKYRCLMFEYFYYTSVNNFDSDKAVTFAQFIAYDENEHKAYEVLDIKPLAFLPIERAYAVVEMSWTFDNNDKGSIKFHCTGYNSREYEKLNETDYAFTPTDDLFYDAREFTATNRK